MQSTPARLMQAIESPQASGLAMPQESLVDFHAGLASPAVGDTEAIPSAGTCSIDPDSVVIGMAEMSPFHDQTVFPSATRCRSSPCGPCSSTHAPCSGVVTGKGDDQLASFSRGTIQRSSPVAASTPKAKASPWQSICTTAVPSTIRGLDPIPMSLPLRGCSTARFRCQSSRPSRSTANRSHDE